MSTLNVTSAAVRNMMIELAEGTDLPANSGHTYEDSVKLHLNYVDHLAEEDRIPVLNLIHENLAQMPRTKENQSKRLDFIRQYESKVRYIEKWQKEQAEKKAQEEAAAQAI